MSNDLAQPAPATRTAPQTPIRLAILGCGRIARTHAAYAAADSRVQIAAVCDPVLAAAEDFAASLPNRPRVFAEVERLLEQAELDACIVCTPTSLHYDHVRSCRRRGLHVLCEKPLADTREKIVALIADTQSPGSPVLSVAYQRRCWPLYRTLRREVQSGRHGAVRAVVTYNAEPWQPTIAGTWRDDPRANPGGFVGDAGSHKIDMVFYVTGLHAVEVSAQCRSGCSQVNVATALNARLSNDAILSMNFIGHAHHWREDFQVHCEHADLVLRDDALFIARASQLERITNLEPGSNPLSAFLDTIVNGGPNNAPAECALPVHDFTQAVLLSAAQGRNASVNLP